MDLALNCCLAPWTTDQPQPKIAWVFADNKQYLQTNIYWAHTVFRAPLMS